MFEAKEYNQKEHGHRTAGVKRNCEGCGSEERGNGCKWVMFEMLAEFEEAIESSCLLCVRFHLSASYIVTML